MSAADQELSSADQDLAAGCQGLPRIQCLERAGPGWLWQIKGGDKLVVSGETVRIESAGLLGAVTRRLASQVPAALPCRDRRGSS